MINRARRGLLWVTWSVPVMCFLSACSSTYVARVKPGLEAFRRGNMAAARGTFAETQKEWRKESHLLGLEKGTASLALDDLATARADFEGSIGKMDALRKSSPLADVGALLLDDTVRAYPGAPFEQIMARVYWAFAYLLSGEARRMEDVSAVCRDLDGKMESIEAYYKLAYPYDEAGNASSFSFQVPPLGKYLAGLAAEQRGELDSALIYMRQAQAGLPGSRFLGRELRRMQQGEHDHLLVVCGLVGMAPRKIPVRSRELTAALQGMKALYFSLNPQDDVDPFLNAALTAPVMVPDIEPRRPRWHGGFIVAAQGGGSARTERIADIDAYARGEFDTLRSGILTRAALRRLLKEVLGQAGAKEAGASAEVGSAVASLLSASETVDLRAWYTLPREIQMARLELSDGCRSITLSPQRPGGGGARGPSIEVPIDPTNPELAFVLVFQPGETATPIVLVDEAHRVRGDLATSTGTTFP